MDKRAFADEEIMAAFLSIEIAYFYILMGKDKKGFYNLFWGAKVTVQMRVLSAPTFFSIKK